MDRAVIRRVRSVHNPGSVRQPDRLAASPTPTPCSDVYRVHPFRKSATAKKKNLSPDGVVPARRGDRSEAGNCRNHRLTSSVVRSMGQDGAKHGDVTSYRSVPGFDGSPRRCVRIVVNPFDVCRFDVHLRGERAPTDASKPLCYPFTNGRTVSRKGTSRALSIRRSPRWCDGSTDGPMSCPSHGDSTGTERGPKR
jgi:hypothetical protein